MAVLSAIDRARTLMAWARAQPAAVVVDRATLQAAVNATDDWIDTNSAAFNSALPVASRNGLTATQKTLLFCYVAMRRAGILTVAEDG